MAFTVADGLTVKLNDCVLPEQLTPPFVKVGVAITVAVTGAEPIFIPLNEAMLPEPLEESPILVALFVQAYVFTPPVLVVPKLIAETEAPLHTT